jgi:hypothetical protein
VIDLTKMCRICSGEYKGQTELFCECPTLTSIPEIPGLLRLICVNCPLLTSIDGLARLSGFEKVYCGNCPLLTSVEGLALISGLQKLYLSNCPITSIPMIPGLQELYCWNCSLLTSIYALPTLDLDCRVCPIFRTIPEIKESTELHVYHCPWVPRGNHNYERNIQALLTLQKFCRKNLKYWRIKNWVGSVECTEWFYDPRNMGGYKHIQRMGKFLSGLTSRGLA